MTWKLRRNSNHTQTCQPNDCGEAIEVDEDLLLQMQVAAHP